MDAILVVNAGSSSIRFAAYQADANQVPRLLGKGHFAQLGSELELSIKDASGVQLQKSRQPSANGFDYQLATDGMFRWIQEHPLGLKLSAVGHRVVHGGARFFAPVTICPPVLDELDNLVSLAPLHQPQNLNPINSISERWPELLQVACFDTAFHSTQPAIAYRFALPREFSDSGIRRYGFHGLSYEYIVTQLPRVLGERAQGRVIVAHLGNGASLCAIHAGKSVATTMGFSALDGLVMGTRCGLLDPGVVLHLLQHRQMTAKQVSDLLYNRSGLLGVSGISSDMQTLLNSEEPHAAEAVELFVYRIVREIGSLAAAMGGLDALVFTGGMGENSVEIRRRVSLGCVWLGADVDQDANRGSSPLFSQPSSRLQLALVPTDEEIIIAGHTAKIVQAASAA